MAKASITTRWKNRIVEHGVKPAKDFLAHPMNYRIHPKAQQDAMAGALAELGWIDEVIENRQTGHVLNGHLRVSLALREGDDTPVPYKLVDLSPEEEALVLATFDPLTALAVSDKEKLKALLQDVQTGDAALQQMLSELAVKDGVIPRMSTGGQSSFAPAYQPNVTPALIHTDVTQTDIDGSGEGLEDTIHRERELRTIICPQCAAEFFIEEAP